jgi:hypothetical protein
MRRLVLAFALALGFLCGLAVWRLSHPMHHSGRVDGGGR